MNNEIKKLLESNEHWECKLYGSSIHCISRSGKGLGFSTAESGYTSTILVSVIWMTAFIIRLWMAKNLWNILVSIRHRLKSSFIN